MISTARRSVAVLAVFASLASVVSGCNRNKVEGEGRLDPGGGVVLTRDEEAETVTSSRSLQSGDTVEVTEGNAKITLPGGDTLELRPRSILVVNDGPELRRGNVLVTTAGPPRTVRAVGSQVDASGAIRIDATLALRVVAYGGRAVIRSGGRTLDVAALREASVPVIGVLLRPVPLAIDQSDAWDRRLLGDAAARESELESLARGFTGQVSAANAASVAYYRSVLPGLDKEQAFQQADVERLGRGTVEPVQPGGRLRAGEVLLGAAIALEGRRGTFAERLAGAAAFRGEGASWALVALDQLVPSIDGLLRLVDGAVNLAPLELAAPGTAAAAAVVAQPPPPPPSPTRRSSIPATTPTTRPPSRTTPTTSRTLPIPPQQQQPAPQTRPPLVLPLEPLLDTTVDPVVNLLNDLLGNSR